MPSRAPFSPSQFTPTKFDTAEDKAKFANHLVRFVQAGFPQTLFPKWFYNRLSNCFGHIAHYDRAGFYDVWFSTTSKQIQFLGNINSSPCHGDPAFTYSDVERALRGWFQENPEIAMALRDKHMAGVRTAELAELARLQAKYDTDRRS